MEIFSKQSTYDFMSKKILFLIISSIFVLGSFVSLYTKGINYGVDFAGGTLVQLSSRRNP